MTIKAKVFISMDYDNHFNQKTLLQEQATSPDFEVKFIDRSLNESQPQPKWEAIAEEAIRKCDILIIMLGSETHSASGVIKEGNMALKHGIPIILVHPNGQENNIGFHVVNLKTGEHLYDLDRYPWDTSKLNSYIERHRK